MTVDTTYIDPPYSVILVSAVGLVGPREKPLARRRLSVEYDVAPFDRQTPALPNPGLGRFINLVDGGGL